LKIDEKSQKFRYRTLYLAYVGFTGGLTGILLWPVVVLHVILTGLLTRALLHHHANAN
jgi:hypothetical protein